MFRGRAAAPLLALVALAGCGHGGANDTPATAEVRGYHYVDNSGLRVGTYGAEIAQPLARGLEVDARVLADHVVIDSRKTLDPATDVPGKAAPDVVTSASATAGGGSVAREWRYEALVAVAASRAVRGAPVSVAVAARGSTEPDYQSVSAAARVGGELFERNLGLALQVGYGMDTIEPVETPVGQEADWPADHARLNAVASASQILSPVLILTGSVGATFQRGQLASPYRKAIVKTTLYPEDVPAERDRFTGLLGLSARITAGTALHLRGGAYLDSWDVVALIPEATLAAELDEGVIGAIRYRLYRQWPASFYRAVYAERLPVMTGDLRLGSLLEHAGALDLRYRLAGKAEGPSLTALASYELSILEYRSVSTRIVAHVFGIGFGGMW